MSAISTVKAKWAGLKGWQKAAVVFGGLFLVSAFGAAGMGVRKYLTQGSARGSLGTTSVSIASSGCMLTSLVMAANTLLGMDRSVEDGNQIVTAARGFSGALLDLPVAARALGVVAREADRIRTGRGATIGQLRARIDETLARGGLAMVNVDKGTYTGTGEHFILVHSRSGRGYAGADPATGTDTFLDTSSLKGTALWGSNPVPYTAVGVAPIYRS